MAPYNNPGIFIDNIGNTQDFDNTTTIAFPELWLTITGY